MSTNSIRVGIVSLLLLRSDSFCRRVGHRHGADIGLDRAEGEIRSLGLGIGDQSIEEGRLAQRWANRQFRL